ncbi:MAG: hypothetical protein V7765_20970 [Oleispira sp.]
MTQFIEVPASKNSLSKRKPVFGIGINDANYVAQPVVESKKISCPYYRAWKNMLMRCYSEKYQTKRPTYIGCSVDKEWLTFSVFRAWMEGQDWQGKQLDKDLLIPGNKEYGPAACIFVSSQINSLLNDHAAERGDFPQGVGFDKALGKYKAYCSVNGKMKHLGCFTSIPEAEITYLTFKSELIKQIASEEEAASNPKLQTALLRHTELLINKLIIIKREVK